MSYEQYRKMKNDLINQVRALLPEKQSIISFVGAGGKTSCVYGLAKQLVREKIPVLITTTTRMFDPVYEQRENIRVFTGPLNSWTKTTPNDNGFIDIAGEAVDSSNHKLVGFSPTQVNQLLETSRYHCILVEADGAKQKALKAPAEHEPVIPDASAIVFGLIGLSCLGKPLNHETVHRAELLSAICHQPLNSVITESTLQSLIQSKQGLFKGTPPYARKVVVLSQASTSYLMQRGNVVRDKILGDDLNKVEEVLIGQIG